MKSLADAVTERFRSPLIRPDVGDPTANPLRRDTWYEPLSRLRGTVDDADGIERIGNLEVFDYLAVPAKRRDSRAYQRLTPLMMALGWTAIKAIAAGGARGDVVRGYERQVRPMQEVMPDTPPETLPAIVDGADNAAVVIQGAVVALTDAAAIALIGDLAYNIQNALRDTDLAAKYALDEAQWRKLANNDALCRAVRTVCEQRVRSGEAPQAEARSYWGQTPSAPSVFNKMLHDETLAPGHRLEAGKRLERAAGLNQAMVGPDSGARPVINFSINFGKRSDGTPVGISGTAFVRHEPDADQSPVIDAAPLPPEDDDAGSGGVPHVSTE